MVLMTWFHIYMYTTVEAIWFLFEVQGHVRNLHQVDKKVFAWHQASNPWKDPKFSVPQSYKLNKTAHNDMILETKEI